MIKIAPSILSADFADMGRAVAKLEEWGAGLVHLDVMDGHFVPNITFGPMMCKAIRPHTRLPIDAHLMVSEPEKWAGPFCEAGADIVTIHIEAAKDARGVLSAIKGYGRQAGIVVKPGTEVSEVEGVLDLCDMVLVMSVEPGFGGQKFMPVALEKIAWLKEWSVKNGKPFDIQVDGGINRDTARDAILAGANVLVAGTGVFLAPDPKAAVEELKRAGQ